MRGVGLEDVVTLGSALGFAVHEFALGKRRIQTPRELVRQAKVLRHCMYVHAGWACRVVRAAALCHVVEHSRVNRQQHARKTNERQSHSLVVQACAGAGVWSASYAARSCADEPSRISP